MQKDLSRARTSFRSVKVNCQDHITKIACRAGVVWAVNEHGRMVVRLAVEKGLEEGLEWKHVQGYE